MSRAQSQEPRLFDQDTCVGDPLERHALLRQGHPERHANRSAPTHALQYALAHSDQAHAVVNTAWPEPPLRDLESSAFAKQNIVGRDADIVEYDLGRAVRSEERRVGKECVRTCRSGWWPYHQKKKTWNLKQ